MKKKKRNKTKIAALLPKINLVNMTFEYTLVNVTILECVVQTKAVKYLLSSRSNQCYMTCEHQVLSQ